MKDVINTLHALVDFLDWLSIQYAVMGGFAACHHGVPRLTYDLDVMIILDRDRVPELFEHLREHDFCIPQVYESGRVDSVKELPIIKLQRIIRDQALDVDIFLAESAFQAEVMRRRSQLDSEGRPTWVVSPEDLVLFKVLAGRPRDLGDIADVLFIQAQLDIQYMRHWAEELDISSELEHALAESSY